LAWAADTGGLRLWPSRFAEALPLAFNPPEGFFPSLRCHAGDFAILYFFLGFFAVFAESLKSFAVGAPGAPGFLIVSPDPAAIRFRLALMFAYSPAFAFIPVLVMVLHSCP
jgi:hypothetical protein